MENGAEKLVIVMGYIEDIKKINALAKELLQHNIVTTQDEAVVKAREMIVKKSGPATVQNEEYIDLSRASVQQQPNHASEEWKDAMAKNNEYLVIELKNIKNAVAMITQEMQSLRTELVSLKQRPQQQPQPQVIPQQTVQVTEVKTQSQQPTQPHPRAGNYTPADVSVEKFFYFGKK